MLLALVTIIPASGLLLYSGLEQRRLAVVDAQEEGLRLVRLSAADQLRFIEGTRQLLTALAQLPEVDNPDSAECAALFSKLLGQYRLYTNLGVLNEEGDLVCSGVPTSAPVNAADRLYFQRAVTTGDFAVGEYQVGRATGKASVGFGYPILGPPGRVGAIVFAGLDLAWLSEVAAAARLPEGATLNVVDQHRTILVRHPDAQDWVGRTASEYLTALEDEMSSPRRRRPEHYGKIVSLSGTDRISTNDL